MKYIDRNGEQWREGYLCSDCLVLWSEEELFNYFDDNEDNVLMAQSLDQCPVCVTEQYDYEFAQEIINEIE